MKKVAGELSQHRAEIIVNAFTNVDRERQKVVNLDLLFKYFNARGHHDVKFGKKAEDDVMMEFYDTFETHHALRNDDPKLKNKSVSLEEFVEYYRVISATVPDDKLFEFMMQNCWALKSIQQVYGTNIPTNRLDIEELET